MIRGREKEILRLSGAAFYVSGRLRASALHLVAPIHLEIVIALRPQPNVVAHDLN
jgi:hypothetical protein